MSRKRSLARIGSGLAATSAFLALAGCAQSGPPPVAPLKPLQFATAPYSRAVTDSLTGSLAYEGDCLLFRDDASDRRITPVWPTGSVFDGTSVIFHSPGKTDQPVVLAQHFVMSGRRLPWSALSASFYAQFEHQCGGEAFLVSEVRPAD